MTARNGSDPIVIAAYARTPMGGFQGALAGLKATELGAAAVKAALRARGRRRRAGRADLHGLRAARGPGPGAGAPGGAGRGPAAARARRRPSTRCAARACRRRSWPTTPWPPASADIIVAGGMESMTNAPYLLAKHRGGARIGHDVVSDSMYLDGLEDAYDAGQADGRLRRGDGRAPISSPARRWTTTRSSSLRRARRAVESGAFDREIVAVEVQDPQGRARPSAGTSSR